MLLSQRIAKDPRYMRHCVPQDAEGLFELRLKIMMATKFIIPSEFIDLTGTDNSKISSLIDNTDLTTKRKQLYRIYAKLPFPTIFIENDNLGILAEQWGDGWKLSVVSRSDKFLSACGLLPFKSICQFTDGEECLKYSAEVNDSTYRHDSNGHVDNLCRTFVVVVCEILLFLNVKNTTIQKYIPTKKENSVIPKKMLPFYEYCILDVFRDRPIYTSLKSIEEDLSISDSEKIHRRAHLVTGHFKTLKTGLFWWNSFVRCRKNKDTIGSVDKDYRLK